VVICEIQEIDTIGGYVSNISSRDVLETIKHKMLMNHIMTEVVVMLSFFAYLLRLKNIIALAPFHQEFELTSFQCQLKGPNKLSLLMDLPLY
jgi:hypothetical protein